MGYSGAGGKLIDEKNQKQKISWHCPFNQTIPGAENISAVRAGLIYSQYCWRYGNIPVIYMLKNERVCEGLGSNLQS